MTNANDILKQWDEQFDVHHAGNFPVMDHPDEFLAAVRLTAYGDGRHWAMTIEQLVFATCSWQYDQFATLVFTYSDVLVGSPGFCSKDGVYPVDEGMDGFLFKDVMDIRPDVRSIRIRDHIVSFDASVDNFSARGIELQFPLEIGGWDLLRLLALDYREQLLATDVERRKRIALPLPQLLQLDEWHHPDIMGGEKPSNTQCFRSLAEVLAAGNPSLYRPTEPPNTDWRNWPRAGML